MSWIRRIRSLLQKQKLDETLDEELQYHIEMRTQEFIAAGMSRKRPDTGPNAYSATAYF